MNRHAINASCFRIVVFQAFENELSNHQFRIDTVLASGQDLIDSNHYASDEIEERCEELSTSWESLMGAAAERKQKLNDALESQKVSDSFGNNLSLA